MPGPVPWRGVPAELAGVLRPVVPEAVDATVAAIAREVPAYRGALEAEIGPTVRRGVEIALARMLELFGTDLPALDARAARFYRRIGAGESDQGRSLEALLSAYRTGARVNWELMSRAATRAGTATEDLIALAESLFVYIDELSSASAEGHAEANALRSGYRGVARSQLAEALVGGLASSAPQRVAELAEAARWQVPARLAVAVVPFLDEGPRLPGAPADVLVVERDAEAVAVIPDPSGPGRRERLERVIGPAGRVFVGTVRVPAEAPISLAHAERVRHLVELGVLPPRPVVAAADHLPELVVTADHGLLEELAGRALAPLDGLSGPRRQILQETLAAWLSHAGDRAAVAEALVVHPQTVSYRLGRLRVLFGDRLDNPRERFTLQLALGVPPARARPG